MKGVILTIAPQAVIIDISHDIQPQNTDEAAYVLFRTYRFFPTNTIHVAVVDPGVGTDRAVLAVRAGGQLFLAPDNGILKYIFDAHPGADVFRVTRTDLFLEPVSHTFHGRDIFAPVAAHVFRGLPAEKLGPVFTPLHQGNVSRPLWRDGKRLEGEIVYFDRFGNAVTNIPEELVKERILECVRTHRSVIRKSVCRYADAKEGEPLVLIGSLGTLELSIRGGSAKTKLRLRIGDKMTVLFKATK